MTTPGATFAAVGAVLCAKHNLVHMPDEGCHGCNPPPCDEALASRMMAAIAKLPVAVERDPALARDAHAARDPRPCCTSGVIAALLAQRKARAERYATGDVQELRDKARDLSAIDRVAADILASAADAIENLTGRDT